MATLKTSTPSSGSTATTRSAPPSVETRRCTALLAEAAVVPAGHRAACGRLTMPPSTREVRLARLRQELASALSRGSRRSTLPWSGSKRRSPPPSGSRPRRPRRVDDQRRREEQAVVEPLRRSACARRCSSADAEAKILKAEEQRLRAAIAAYQAQSREHAHDASRSSRRCRATTTRPSSATNRSVKRHEEAQLAESMEQRQKGEQFRILDPAVPRRRPAAPNRLRLLLVSLALSAGIARLAPYLAEKLDTSFHSVAELRAFTTVPVLVSISRIVSAVRPAARPPSLPAGRGRGECWASSSSPAAPTSSPTATSPSCGCSRGTARETPP